MASADSNGNRFGWTGTAGPVRLPQPHGQEQPTMADDTDDAGDAGVLDAEVLKLGGIRDRIGRGRFHEAVRAELTKQLNARAKKPKAGFKAAEVPMFVGKVTDNDIEEAAQRVAAQDAAPVPEAADAEAKGPIRDWFAANPELVQKVVELLLRLILGA
jgi:hypothetical protein